MRDEILKVKCINKEDLGTGAYGQTRVFYIFKETCTEELFIYWTTTSTKIGKNIKVDDICKLKTCILESENKEGLAKLIRPTILEE